MYYLNFFKNTKKFKLTIIIYLLTTINGFKIQFLNILI